MRKLKNKNTEAESQNGTLRLVRVTNQKTLCRDTIVPQILTDSGLPPAIDIV